MSLIVARKDQKCLYIVSDTKLTDLKSRDRQKIDPKDGVIKTIIINEFSCISFAGNVVCAEEALKEIGKESDIDKIISILLFHHNKSDKITDFIFCVGRPDLLIFEIRDSTVNKVSSSWIGSKRGFEKFQSVMLGTNDIISQQISFSIENSNGSGLFQDMAKALDEVINDESIPEISGFKVKVCYDGKRFSYLGYFESYWGSRPFHLNIPPGHSAFVMPLTQNASDGGYSVNFFNSSIDNKYVGLHITQGNFGIIYSRKDGGLMYPELFVDMDELDYWDFVKEKYKISPIGTTQSVVRKYGYLGESCMKLGQIEDAYIWYSKGVDYSHGKEKANFYYNQAVCLLGLKRFPEATCSFSEAIKLNGIYQKMATEIMRKTFGRKF